MWMRFDLFERVARRRFAAVKVAEARRLAEVAPGPQQRLRLHQARAGADRAGVVPRAGALPLVRRKGGVLRSATRTSAICKQPDPRPDLRAGALDAAAARCPTRRSYALDVRNDGRTAAGPFDVVLTVGGAAQPPRTSPAARAARRTPTVTFGRRAARPARRCASTLDAEDAVDEVSEADDVVDRACPFG